MFFWFNLFFGVCHNPESCYINYCYINHLNHLLYVTHRRRAIISRGLYNFYPILENHFFVFEEFFSENSALGYG